ncbi:unnamed protein product [Dicrocoelium dendriticum]|nr:unnamed protein product [Dicrocoelium dendriticum]
MISSRPMCIASKNGTSSLINEFLKTDRIHSKTNSKVFVVPRSLFNLATFNVRTLMQVGSQAATALTLETLSIDVCRLTETRLQEFSTTLRLLSPSLNSNCTFPMCLSGDATAATSGCAGVGVALSARVEAALIDWFLVNSSPLKKFSAIFQPRDQWALHIHCGSVHSYGLQPGRIFPPTHRPPQEHRDTRRRPKYAGR